MIFFLFSGLEQLYGVANYEKVVWFKRVHALDKQNICQGHAVVSCIWRRVGGWRLRPPAYQLTIKVDEETFYIQLQIPGHLRYFVRKA